ncbi:pilus assembly protein MshP [Sulfuriflexus mobilis]|uniref:pilus assembly protein MshP n=1 Tax=Sulfuriflexus mobilis TaxID=1811807 RepID=UPI000F8307B1|nr:pilus assembly protein MshP [Sulfuriflexus mobilis]
MLPRQKGFSLVTAIFLLVVLSAIGAFMVTIGGTQRTTTTAALQGARAFQAARSGIEWAIARVLVPNATCTSITDNPSFAATAPGQGGFAVTVMCTSSSHTEAGNNINIFVITSEARFSNYGSADFVRRRITATISLPPP